MTNEKRLIDANALKDKLETHHDFFVSAWGGFSNLPTKDKARVDEISHCIAEVVNAPTVEAVEVVHGKWVEGGLFSDIAKCSICGAKYFTMDFVLSNKFNYCPNCGAKMDGGNEDA